ncbi:MMPL family transporter [Paenibacillus urinalis]|uniref:MMPL family transporter n=2 Tax=Paenibacillus TaxID=44249 RepID=A0ABY7XI08_9BACL|nr:MULTISPECIES: MMPL family transporter [Paenibacillus]WDH99653.1 MMPL family transporter [Paenibacillus urinalis]WDI03285.1 MMPL family transporter [Paenibacillus urinalis]GAK42389.1 RND superfamily drug exporter [Paenibacillus sp. TCA20]
MRRILSPITDWVSTKRGMWITIVVWLAAMIGLSAGPMLSEYKVTNFQSLPDEAQSIIAEQKLAETFPNEQGAPGILVFHNESGVIDVDEVRQILSGIISANIEGVDSIVDISALPDQALSGFTSEDGSTMIVPMSLEAGIGNSQYSEINDEAYVIGSEIAKDLDTKFYITGPAGIAGDTVKLFEQADLVLLLATIVIILILLIAIYRSPLLAIIPLLATVIVYQVANQSIALMGAAGLEINNSTTSIMSILLFAAVIDYSLFVFSRYREELNKYESKYTAMQHAMRATGEPVFFAGGTVLAAMLILFFTDFRDYQNFAPVFGLAMFIIMLASVTLVPALFTLFGRKAFWPKAPKIGQEHEMKHGIWGPIAKFVVNKPLLTGGIVAVFMVITALNVFNLRYEFDTVKKFPVDLPSRVGYEIVETKYNKGELAPSTILLESEAALSEDQINQFLGKLENYEEINSVRTSGVTEDTTAAKFSVALTMNPYSTEAIDFVEELRSQSEAILNELSLQGDVYFGGVTAKLVDERTINNSDIVRVVILETILILVLLIALTRSLKMSIYMIATILISYVSALGLGLFLVDVLFGYDAISTRVPVYAFIFLVALGIDYNIILISRFLEERKTRKVKDALEVAIRNTGGVISSAGVILAATFAALTTMPIADLFVFGFIVAIGILIDTFLVRGMLLPSLILFFEKDKDM